MAPLFSGGRLSTLYMPSNARYNPATDTWSAISTVNEPSPRDRHVSVWTGTRMVIWGLPELMARSEREWLARALREYGALTRREIADRLRISEAALYKKLKQHGLGGSD